MTTTTASITADLIDALESLSKSKNGFCACSVVPKSGQHAAKCTAISALIANARASIRTTKSFTVYFAMQPLGIFEGTNSDEALDDMCRKDGYKSFIDHCEKNEVDEYCERSSYDVIEVA